MIGTWLHFGLVHNKMVIPLVSDDDLLSRLVFWVRVFLDYYHHILRLLICGSLAYDDAAACSSAECLTELFMKLGYGFSLQLLFILLATAE